VVVPSRRVDVRRLQRADGPGLEALLDGEPGYSLFLRGNLGALAVDDRVQYWGVVVDGAPRAALMLVGNRGALYAPPGGPIAPLAEIAAEHGLGFAMGRTDLVEALVASSPDLALTRRQEHVLARLARADLAPPYAPPAVPLPPLGVRVRRARPGDLGGLVRLYTGAAGFERATPARVRASLRERVLSLRTHVARARGRILAAASTSSEAPRAAMIGGVWTDPAWRGRGVGTAVVAALARELLAEGRAPHLFYLVDNAPAARVYAKIGFRPVGPWTVVYFDR
jgi:GNAT superfamily N-acetyltransferase